MNINWQRFLTAAGLTLLAACGGGGGGSSGLDSGSTSLANTGAPASGIDRSGVTVGTITAFGSVFVGGVRFGTLGAEILDDGISIGEDDLEVGDVVRIEGTVNDDGVTGTAQRIVFDAEVEGPIVTIDLAAGTFTVLGRTVRTDAETVFDNRIVPRSLAGLAVDDVVEVSGFLAADGAVLATRIEPASGSGPYEVKGRVAALDEGARSFTLGSLTVDYGNAVLEDFDGATIETGDPVEVRGTEFDGNGALLATVVELEDDEPLRGGDDGDLDDGDFEVEGLITAIDGNDLIVGNQPVRIVAETIFENGSADDLALDRKVEVEGGYDADGVFVAAEISLRFRSDTEIEGVVEAIDEDAQTLLLEGFTVAVLDTTQFEDDSDAEVRRFSLADLAIGDRVEVKGRLFDGVLQARRIEREDPDEDGDDDDDGDDDPLRDDDLQFEGTLTAFETTGLSLLGYDFLIDDETRFELDDVDVSEAEFRAVITVGDRVDVRALRTETGSLLVTRIENESE